MVHARAADADEHESTADRALRSRLLEEGEALPVSGDAAAALEVFQRAALQMHTPEIESSIVRAQMQSGRYRQALAVAAHAALAHRHYSGGVALYAWTLAIGGQPIAAERLLTQAVQAAPGDLVLRLTQEQLRQPWPRLPEPLLMPPLRGAPYAYGPGRANARAQVVGAAMLVDGGHAALLPSATAGSHERVWLRSGLGPTVEARITTRFEDVSLARADLASPRALGIALRAGPRGAPVFDRNGHLCGMSMPGEDGVDRMLPFAALPVRVGAIASGRVAVPGVATGPLDAVYESALYQALQVISAAA